MNRRSALTTPLGALATASWSQAFASVAAPSLDQAAARAGLFYGSAVRLDDLRREPDLQASVLQECAYLVPETALKWAEIEPKRGELSLAAIDDLVAFATAHAKKVRGHTLLWHRSVPGWAETALKGDDGWALIDRYFSSVIPRYGAAIDQWDVVNEPIAEGQGGGLRQNVFLQAFGPDYIHRALVTARKYAPRSKLMINEFGLEYETQEDGARRATLLALIRKLKAQGAPLDGVGLQSHLDLSQGSVSKTQLTGFLDAISEMGLFFVVTELDVKESAYTDSPADRDRLVGEEVARYLDIVLSHKAARGVMTWGLSDRHSWLKVEPSDYAKYPAAWHDGTGPGPNRGLPLSGSLVRKPMYYAIRDALLKAPGPLNR